MRHSTRLLISLALSVLNAAAIAAPGLLIFEIDAVKLDSQGEPTRTGDFLTGYALRNLSTKKSSAFLYARGVQAEEMEEGVYCVDSITIGRNNSFEFCNEPYFRVTAGRMNNAGHWRFGIASDLSTAKMVHAVKYADETMSTARTQRAEEIARFIGKLNVKD